MNSARSGSPCSSSQSANISRGESSSGSARIACKKSRSSTVCSVLRRKRLLIPRRRNILRALVEDAHLAELLVALLQQVGQRDLLELAQRAQEICLQDVAHLLRVA